MGEQCCRLPDAMCSMTRDVTSNTRKNGDAAPEDESEWPKEQSSRRKYAQIELGGDGYCSGRCDRAEVRTIKRT